MLRRIFKVKRVEASGPWRMHDEGHHDVTSLTSRTDFIQLTTTEGYAVHKEEKINVYLPNRRIGTTWMNLS